MVIKYYGNEILDTFEFGQKNPKIGTYIDLYENYPDYAEERRAGYISRHMGLGEDWTDINKPGTWSRYILWEMPTIEQAIKNMQKKFDIEIDIVL